MSTATKISVLGGLVLLAVLAVAANFVLVQEKLIDFTRYTTNAGELTSDSVVGQTFVAGEDNLSAVGVMFATYSDRDNTGRVIFHLREGIDARDDIRRESVGVLALGDNKKYVFKFEPIKDSKDTTYFFYVEAPDSTPGNSVTVDLDTTDPYHLGTAFIARGVVGGVLDPVKLAMSGKQTIDVVFTTYHEVSMRTAMTNSVIAAGREFVVTWATRRGDYYLLAELLIPAVLFLSLLIALGRGEADDLPRKYIILGVSVLVVLALAARWFYARQMSLTNDEGNYLYDASTLLRGKLAGGDGYVKAPLVIGWLAVWEFILGHTIMAGRIASAVAGAAAVWPMYIIGREAGGKKAGLLSAAAWALFGATTVGTIYVHTQTLAIFLGLAGVAVVWSTLRAAQNIGEDLKQEELSMKRMFAAGLLLGLAVACRKSMLAWGLPALVLILLEVRGWRQKIKVLVMVGLGFGVVIGLMLGLAWWLYGLVGIREVTGLNSAEDGLSSVDPDQADQVRAYSLKGMTPFFRESLPLILLSLLGWGLLLEQAGRKTLAAIGLGKRKRAVRFLGDVVLPKVLWILPLLVFAWAWSFFFEYEGEFFWKLDGIKYLWYAMGGVIILAALWPRAVRERVEASDTGTAKIKKSTQPPVNSILPNVVGRKPGTNVPFEAEENKSGNLVGTWAGALMIPLWLIGLVFLYMHWIKFHANYIIEFLPPLAALAGVGALLWWRRVRVTPEFVEEHPLWTIGRRFIGLAAALIIVWSVFVSSYVTYIFEHTGTFDLGALNEAAVWAKENIPADESIFTGAAAVPYLSGHQVALDIAHPRWYAYEFTREDPDRLDTFLPPKDEMVGAFRQARWFLNEQQTSFSFMMEYSEIEKGLADDFELAHEVENGSNTLSFYRRIRPAAGTGQ
ncbi:MAG: glycosyltransferase family 39 protein [Candidatus Andersenbacteria bacterium]|nr:glycosyltransferase family 39 protein [bacterium]MDZ4225656.1 glycosyltransferase family 39 protein [Candidatus Andersenbacteria bacterium]